MEERDRSPLGRYRSDLRGVIGTSASAYGYTLTVWSSGSMLAHFHGSPGPAQVFAFFGGAIVAFALVGALAFGGVTARFGGGSGRIELWGSFHFLSVGLAVGAASLVAAYVPGLLGWPAGAFVATAAYLAVVGAENAAADLGPNSS